MKLSTPFSGSKSSTPPEQKIRQEIRDFLTLRGWFVIICHGNLYQSGLPDLFCCHQKYGQRWVEVKDPNRSGDIFTAAQHSVFPKLSANGSGVWVLVAGTEAEYNKLFERPNWYQYLGIFTRTKGLG